MFSVLLAGILLISVAGYYARLLSFSGMFASALLGTLLTVTVGWQGLLLLAVFFASSSGWSKWKVQKKEGAEEKSAKKGRRDAQQVAANGGPAALFAIGYALSGNDLWLAGYAAALAAANADTWASEIGVLSRSNPFSVRTFKQVEPGTSGAVSLLGMAATVSGSLTIALTAWAVYPEIIPAWIVAITLAGVLGSLIDTWLGAYVQVEYRCKVCGLKTEADEHHGERTVKIKGLPFVNNEIVNATASFCAGLAAYGVLMI